MYKNEKSSAFKVPLAGDPNMILSADWGDDMGGAINPIEFLERREADSGCYITDQNSAMYSKRFQERMLENCYNHGMREYSRQQEYTRKEAYDVKKEERKRRQKFEDEYAAGKILERNDGSLYYAIDVSEKEIYGFSALNCAAYMTTLLVCNFPRKVKVLEVTVVMKTGEQKKFHVMESQSGFSSKTFAKEFAKAGLKIAVSKKKAAEVHSCLLDYSLEIAERKNVYFSYGWWKTEDGSWRFVEEVSDILWRAKSHV